jgi:dTDP-4-dehydrorhamnose reductase
MRILLLGKIGQLGWELQRTLAPLGPLTALDYPEIDLLHLDTLSPKIEASQAQVIINATAYTAVDRAESEADIARGINALAPGWLAQKAAAMGAAFIHFSTDYVFDGGLDRPYVETDTPNPLNVYGESKLEGERRVQTAGDAYLILRTSWVYSLRRSSFVTKVLGWARQKSTLRLVTDQVSNPTWARMLAEVTAQLLASSPADFTGWLRPRRGLYHLAGDGYASRKEWAEAVLQFDPNPQEQTVTEILPALTSEFPAPAQRPLFSALDCTHFSQVFGLQLPHWRRALKLAMEVEK